MAVVTAAVAGVVGLIFVIRSRALARETAREEEMGFRRQYDFWIRQAQHAWDNYDFRRLDELLDFSITGKAPGQSVHEDPDLDPGGFECHFWRRRLTSGHQSFIGRSSVAFTPDGQSIAFATDTGVRIIEIRSGLATTLLARKEETGWIESLATSPDGGKVASGESDGTIRVIDRRTGRELPMKGHRCDAGPVLSVAFSPDRRHLAAADSFPGARVWDVKTGQTQSIFGQTRENTLPVYTCVASSNDGARLAAACSDLSLRVWNAPDGREVLVLKGHGAPVVTLAFSRDGRSLASASGGSEVKVGDTINGQLNPLVRGHNGPFFDVLFSPDGSRLATTGRESKVRIWDAEDGREIMSLEGPANSSNRAIDELDVNAGRLRRPITRIAFSPNGKRLAAPCARKVIVWDTAAGRLVFTFTGHSDLVTGIVFSSDGSHAASSGFDGVVKARRADDGKEELTLYAHARKQLSSDRLFGWGRAADEGNHRAASPSISGR
jgi:WD40 repeat protein